MVSSINYHSVNVAKHTLLETWHGKKNTERETFSFSEKENIYWEKINIEKTIWEKLFDRSAEHK